MKVFGFNEVGIELSTRPEKYIGSLEDWKVATDALEGALQEKGLTYDINEGDGAFYGPKIDIKLKDALKRSWQCATIQCDFALPKRFDLHYVDADGKKAQPIMIHRVLLGSVERFIGALVEHYKGALPLWLAPTQVVFIPIKEQNAAYCVDLKKSLGDKGVRVDIDGRNETLNKRIRNAELNKIPYIIVVGDQESAHGTVSVRKKGSRDVAVMTQEEFALHVEREIKNKQ